MALRSIRGTPERQKRSEIQAT